MLNALSTAMFALVLRLASETKDAPRGLLALADHPHFAPSLAALFNESARAGSLPGLARQCNMGNPRREAQPGSCTERENLIGDAKGKGASGSNREAESTDAPGRRGLLRSSDEAGVMPVEQGSRPSPFGSGQPATGGT
jgi:hypothetical protein